MIDIKKTIKALKENGFDAEFFENRDALYDRINREVSSSETVGIGGSVTIRELGLFERLTVLNKKVFWHWEASGQQPVDIFRKALCSDVYLASSNAITEDGKVINIDCNGNRVAALIYGPEKVIVIAGTNKITKDEQSGRQRIKTVACPKNGNRLNLKLPCVEYGKCLDCRSKDRMCGITTILERRPALVDFKVFILGESLGF